MSQDSLVKANKAYSHATIYALANSYFEITNSKFDDNWAQKHSSVLYAISTISSKTASITGCQINQNEVEDGSAALTLLFVDMIIQSTTFDSNIASEKTNNVFSLYSNLVFENVGFNEARG